MSSQTTEVMEMPARKAWGGAPGGVTLADPAGDRSSSRWAGTGPRGGCAPQVWGVGTMEHRGDQVFEIAGLALHPLCSPKQCRY